MKVQNFNLSGVIVNKVTSKNNDEKNVESKRQFFSDRVEFSGQKTIEEVNRNISDSIASSSKARVSDDRLQAIKQKIQQNEYYVSSMDIARAML